MNYKIAIDILDLSNNFTKKELKQAYLKKCLQHHPDKNKSNGSMFIKCKDAYDYLLERENYDHTNEENSGTYTDMIKNYLSLISEKYGWDQTILHHVFDLILKDGTKISFKICESMDYETLVKIYEYINKFQSLFNIQQTTINKLREIIKSKSVSKSFISLTPTLDELLEDQIFVLTLENTTKTKYIPLWHNELHYDDCVIHINPILPNHMDIDQDNNLNVFINMTESEMFSGEKKEITICDGHTVKIDTNNLFCRKFQKYTVYNCGISRINEEEVFNVNKRGNIIFHINKV